MSTASWMPYVNRFRLGMSKNKNHRPFIVFLLALSVFFGTTSAIGSGIMGIQQAEYRFMPPAAILPYRNAGYQIKESSDGIIHVKVNATPLRNSTPYPTVIENKPARALLDSGQHPHLSAAFRAKTRKLVQPCRGYFQAVSVILNWITRHFHYQLQIKSPLDGDCTAAAQLAVQMLSEAGIPARTVIGIVVESKDHVLSGKALHSFVEIYYPGTGWLFSDPLSSYHYVPANYVLLNTAHASDYFGLTLRTVRQPAPLESVVSHEHSPIPGRINLFRFN